MKELSIEEKAKAYDEAIRIAKSMYQSNETEIGVKDHLSVIFPELSESEDDRIRQKLLFLCYSWRNNEQVNIPDKEEVEKTIAWLEELGEHANFRNKIQIGDKVTRNEDGVLVNLSQLNRVAKPADKVKPKFKVGDTVTVKPMSCHGKVFKGKPFKIVDIIEDNYVSDDGKTYSISLQDGWELVEQHSAWSKEDEIALGDALWCCEKAASIAKDENDMGNIWYAENWLKSLKDRVHLQNAWKPSDEQMAVLSDIAVTGYVSDAEQLQELISLYNDLKKLRRNNYETA